MNIGLFVEGCGAPFNAVYFRCGEEVKSDEGTGEEVRRTSPERGGIWNKSKKGAYPQDQLCFFYLSFFVRRFCGRKLVHSRQH